MSRPVPEPWRRAGHEPRRGVRTCAAVTLLAVSALADAADLPRVFYTPGERAAITAARMAGRTLAPQESAAVAAGAVTGVSSANPASGDLEPSTGGRPRRAARVEGVTLGRDARPAVWIGGERIADGGRWGRFRVHVTRDGARLLAADGSVRVVRVGMELQP